MTASEAQLAAKRDSVARLISEAVRVAKEKREQAQQVDVKGKVSVSLHNVTWEQALDTILEARGLQRLDRNGIIHIVTTH